MTPLFDSPGFEAVVSWLGKGVCKDEKGGCRKGMG
jgi:hypothetical protein